METKKGITGTGGYQCIMEIWNANICEIKGIDIQGRIVESSELLQLILERGRVFKLSQVENCKYLYVLILSERVKPPYSFRLLS